MYHNWHEPLAAKVIVILDDPELLKLEFFTDNHARHWLGGERVFLKPLGAPQLPSWM
jgi:hypothetical protein